MNCITRSVRHNGPYGLFDEYVFLPEPCGYQISIPWSDVEGGSVDG